jgi:hypothetical protein
VQRIWRAHGLQPHRLRQFKLSNDPNFEAAPIWWTVGDLDSQAFMEASCICRS